MSFITGFALIFTIFFGLLAMTGLAEFLAATTPFFFAFFLFLTCLSIFFHVSDSNSRKL